MTLSYPSQQLDTLWSLLHWHQSENISRTIEKFAFVLPFSYIYICDASDLRMVCVLNLNMKIKLRRHETSILSIYMWVSVKLLNDMNMHIHTYAKEVYMRGPQTIYFNDIYFPL